MMMTYHFKTIQEAKEASPDLASFLKTIHTKQTIASAYGWPYRTFLKRLQAMLDDEEISKDFGQFEFPATPKQLLMIVNHFGEPTNVTK